MVEFFPGNESHEPEAIQLRIQAKRLHLRVHKDHHYKDLNHKSGKQLDDLIRESNKIKAIPLCCFYNFKLKMILFLLKPGGDMPMLLKLKMYEKKFYRNIII